MPASSVTLALYLIFFLGSVFVTYRFLKTAPARRERRLALAQQHAEQVAHEAAQEDAARSYGNLLREMVEAKHIDEARLSKLSEELELESVADIRAKEAKSLFTTDLDEAVKDGRLSDEDELSLAFVIELLKITPSDGEYLKMGKAREVYCVESKPLPPKETSYNLQKGEVCYANVTAEAAEERTRTVSVGYRGPVMRLRIAKGLSYRIGSVKLSPHRENYMASFGSGELAITNSRIILALPNKSLTIRYKSIIDVEYFTDGVKIHKTSGKPVLLTYGTNPSIATILARCMIGGDPLT